MLYGIDLREYKGVEQNAHTDWSPSPAGIFQTILTMPNGTPLIGLCE
jgi:alpha-L-fucosidase